MRKHSPKKILISVLALGFVVICAAAQTTGAQTAKRAVPKNLDEILKNLAAYNGGLESDAFWDLRNFVLARKDSPEERLACEIKLAAFLGSKATLTAKTAVCRELRVIGGDKSVPALEKMLLQKDTADIARYALEKIPGAAADEALVGALAKTNGGLKKGIITSLGQRKTRSSVVELGKLLRGPDTDLAGAAAIALGQIGGMDAAEALGRSLSALRSPLKETAASALFKCAEEFITLKDAQASFQIYDKILGEKLPSALRLGAMRGKIATAGGQAQKLILETLAGADQTLYAPAIGSIKTFFKETDIGSICAILPKLPAPGQVQLLAVLAEYPGQIVRPVVSDAAKSPNMDVRVAALKALEKTGDASVVLFLAQTAAVSTSAEQTSARTSLWGLKGRDVDDKILSLLIEQKDEGILAELVQCVGERRIFAGKSAALKQADSPSAKIRDQALRALKTVGTPSDIPGLLDLLLKTPAEADQTAIENTIVGLAQKISDPNERAGSVQALLNQERGIRNRAPLFRVLGKIGDGNSLSLLRDALLDKDPVIIDAAVRALASWPTAAARDDVFNIARTSKNEVHKVLALRGFVRMVGLDPYRKPEAVVTDLENALRLVSRPEEKKLILGILPDFACPEALKAAETLMNDKDVKDEAKLALDKIRKALIKE